MAKDMFNSLLDGAEKSLTMALHQVHKQMLDEYNERIKMERMKKEITEDVTNNVLKNINVVLMDEASPQIRKLKQDIEKAFND